MNTEQICQKNPTLQIINHPNMLAPYYSKFKVDQRYLLTGHAHQAWPDCSAIAQEQAWQDAATYLDRKWEFAFTKAELVKEGYRKLLDDDQGIIALGTNTHELLLRFLGSLDYSKGNHIITSDNEFHSARLQLECLNTKNWIELTQVAGHPTVDVADRICNAIHSKTIAVIISAVYYTTGQIVENLSQILSRAEKFGAKLVIDAYHALNVLPFSIKEQKLEQAFILGGGYKYCQLGEGNAFLRYPKEYTSTSLITGWLSDSNKEANCFKNLQQNALELFPRSTYDPASHYRAVAVFNFFTEQHLPPKKLREINQYQLNLIADCFDSFDLNPKIIARDASIPTHKIGGFLVFKTPYAKELQNLLYQRSVYVDFRNNLLRFGPAPYLSNQQIIEAMEIVKEVVLQFERVRWHAE